MTRQSQADLITAAMRNAPNTLARDNVSRHMATWKRFSETLVKKFLPPLPTLEDSAADLLKYSADRVLYDTGTKSYERLKLTQELSDSELILTHRQILTLTTIPRASAVEISIQPSQYAYNCAFVEKGERQDAWHDLTTYLKTQGLPALPTFGLDDFYPELEYPLVTDEVLYSTEHKKFEPIYTKRNGGAEQYIRDKNGTFTVIDATLIQTRSLSRYRLPPPPTALSQPPLVSQQQSHPHGMGHGYPPAALHTLTPNGMGLGSEAAQQPEALRQPTAGPPGVFPPGHVVMACHPTDQSAAPAQHARPPYQPLPGSAPTQQPEALRQPTAGPPRVFPPGHVVMACHPTDQGAAPAQHARPPYQPLPGSAPTQQPEALRQPTAGPPRVFAPGSVVLAYQATDQGAAPAQHTRPPYQPLPGSAPTQQPEALRQPTAGPPRVFPPGHVVMACHPTDQGAAPAQHARPPYQPLPGSAPTQQPEALRQPTAGPPRVFAPGSVVLAYQATDQGAAPAQHTRPPYQPLPGSAPTQQPEALRQPPATHYRDGPAASLHPTTDPRLFSWIPTAPDPRRAENQAATTSGAEPLAKRRA